jgi:hypothetical protein
MREFVTKRVVLTEKTLKSTNQITTFLECELINCSLYEYGSGKSISTFFYVKDDVVFVEIQLNKNKTEFLFNKNVFKGFKVKEIESKLNKLISKNLFQIEERNQYEIVYLSQCSSLRFILENSYKLR